MDISAALHDWLPLIFVLAGIGCVAGFLSGLMGIGGGIVLVPGLYYSMALLGYDPGHLMHMAVGTSLAVMIPTGFTSARAHWKRGAVSLDNIKKIGPGILIGVAAGTALADIFSGAGLRAFFAVALMILSMVMFSDPSRYSVRDGVPGQPFAGAAGAAIGAISTLMGIGGAVMSVPFMSLCRVRMHTAVGTAAALGQFISIPGMIGFIYIGWSAAALPPLSLGYVNLLAAALLIPFSILMAPQGAKLAHSLDVRRLRQVFAALLFLIAGNMLREVFWAG